MVDDEARSGGYEQRTAAVGKPSFEFSCAVALTDRAARLPGQRPSRSPATGDCSYAQVATAPAAAAPVVAVARRNALPAAQATPTPPAPAATAESAKAQQLIQQAERSYASGVTNYRAGRLDAARTDFDSAVDLLLTSGMNIKTDSALSDEMEHLPQRRQLARDGRT